MFIRILKDRHMIHYARHGESVANRDKYFAGRIDSPLTERGRLQAAMIGQEIVGRAIQTQLLVSSPMSRALESTKIVAGVIGYPLQAIEIDERLTEYDFGDLTGQPKEGVDHARFYAANGREPANALWNRVVGAWNDYCERNRETLIIGHSFVGLMIECLDKNGDFERFNEMPTDPNNNGVIVSYESSAIFT